MTRAQKKRWNRAMWTTLQRAEREGRLIIHRDAPRRNPFKLARPAEWATMTRKQRTKWNKEHWVPDQYVADKSLLREQRRLTKRKVRAEMAQRRGGGIFGLAKALAHHLDE